MKSTNRIDNTITGDVTGVVVQAAVVEQVVVPRQRVPVPRQLPADLRDFTGRIGDLTALDALLSTADAEPVVVVVEGLGGIGKTSLVVHWARREQDRFPDGTLFVNLRAYGPSRPLTSTVVLGRFLEALGVSAERVPAQEDAQVALYRSMMAGRRILVVLDNAESAAQVRSLLPGVPGCAVLVTSRRSLIGLSVTDGAVRLPIGLLPTGEALALVRGVIGPDVTDHAQAAAARLVDLCAGLPLALRIAACRVAARPRSTVNDVVEGIVGERDPVAALEVFGDPDSAVRAVFDASYKTLDLDQARLFRLLGMHPGPEFGVRAAAVLSGLDEAGAHRLLESLLDLHLVEQTGRKRYRMHDLVHAYAVGRCESDEAAGERRRAVTAVLTWYADTANHADQVLFPGTPRLVVHGGSPVFDRAGALEWLVAETPTIVAAVEAGERARLWRPTVLLACACRFLTARHRAYWPLRLAAESLGLRAARRGGDLEAETVLLLRRADTYQEFERWADADEDLRRALALAGARGDTGRMCAARGGLGFTSLSCGRHEEAAEHYRAALPLARAAGDVRAEAVVECNLGAINVASGHYRQGLRHLERELLLRRAVGDAVGEAYALFGAALAWQRLAEHERAIGLIDHAVRLYRGLGLAEELIATALEAASRSYESLGRQEAAATALRTALTMLEELGDPRADALRARLDGRPPTRQ